jgi:hypothetical protein
VIRRHVLAALADAIDVGNDDAARRTLRKVDWVARRRARRRLEGALIDAALLSHEYGGVADPEAARHVQRVAALRVAKAAAVDPTDRAAVAAAYAALPRVRAPRFPLFTFLAALLAGAVIAGGVILVIAGSGPVQRAYERPLPTPVAGAFEHGGVPLADPPLAKLLTEDLTELVIATDHDRMTGGLDKHRKAMNLALLAPQTVVAKGPGLARAWQAMIEMFDRWTTLPFSDADFDRLAKELRMRVRGVSDQLAALGIGYYLEADMFASHGTAHAVIYSYRVEEVVFVRAGGKPRRVLSLRRLDQINLHHSLLGMQSEELGDPVLLLDEIDQHVTREVFPVLAPGATYVLAEDAWLATEPGKSLAAATGAAVRAELAAALGKDADAAAQIAVRLHERRDQLEEWSRVLQRRGWVVPEVDDLFVPDALLDSLDGQVPDGQIVHVKRLDDEIAQLEGPRIASLCHQLVAATVRRHEAQHGLDDDREVPLRYPPQLEALLGPAESEDGKPVRSVTRASAELSAYTSQLANDVSTPQLALWNILRFAFTEREWGTAESYAGVLIAEGLARHLHIPSDGPVIHDHVIDRERLAKLVAPMAHLDGNQLRAAAREVWKDFYDEDLVPITDK